MSRDPLWKILKVLPTDYTDYGGECVRWESMDKAYPDCSCGCKFFHELDGEKGSDWGVCTNPKSPRAGLLTWEHQAGEGCFVLPRSPRKVRVSKGNADAPPQEPPQQ